MGHKVMKHVNLPGININTYGNESFIEHLIPGILTSGMKCVEGNGPEVKVWYCGITTPRSLTAYDFRELLGDEFYSQVLQKELSIYLDLSFEPFLTCIDNVYHYLVIKHDIPSSQVIFASNMFDAKTYNIEIAKKLNVEPIKTIFIPTLEFFINQQANINPSLTAKTLQNKEYTKKFLNFNRRWRSHRPILTLLLRHYNLLNKGFVSFGPCEHHTKWEEIFDGMIVTSIGNQEMFDAIMANKDIKDMPPLYLDTDNLSINRPEPEISTIKYYENSYFSVVSETTFYNKDTTCNSRFITEKTFKAILFEHPFILVSIPKSLEVLKYLGYKTFSPFIDESYDQELDDNKRMMMIVREIERLCNLSDADLETFLVECKKICKYNYNHLLNKRIFMYE